jgi:hypothetical protein
MLLSAMSILSQKSDCGASCTRRLHGLPARKKKTCSFRARVFPPAINKINPDHALGFTGIGLPVENTLISLRRLHSPAFGFETFAFWQKTGLSRRSTVFQGNPIPVLTKYLGQLFLLCKLICREKQGTGRLITNDTYILI